MRSLIVTMLAVALGSFAIGCSRDRDRLSPTDASDAPPSADAAVPEGFPREEVPLPEGELRDAGVTDVRGADVFVLTVEGEPDAVTDYQTALEDAGYEVTELANGGDRSTGFYNVFTALGHGWLVGVFGSNVGGTGSLLVSVAGAA